MKGAVRVFASDYNSSTLSKPDGENAPWVVTPGGAWCRQIFLAGALTEVDGKGDVLRCRVADPTGAFDLTIGGRRTGIAESIRKIPVPSFVTVSGLAQSYRSNGRMVVSVRPENILSVDRGCRDSWVLETAQHTLDRLEELFEVMQGRSENERATVVFRHYSHDLARFDELTQMASKAVESVRSATPHPVITDEELRATVLTIMTGGSSPRGIAVQDIIDRIVIRGISSERTLAAIESLIKDDECYQPQKGYVRPL